MILQSIIRTLMVFALSVGVLVLPAYLAVPHLGVVSLADHEVQHAVLHPDGATDQGHNHEDEDGLQPNTGHAHGHDPSDHSHQIPFVSACVADIVRPLSASLVARVYTSMSPETDFGIHRPPRRCSFA